MKEITIIDDSKNGNTTLIILGIILVVLIAGYFIYQNMNND